MYTAVRACRLCGHRRLRSLVHLGDLALTGVFPRAGGPPAPRGPLELVRCDASACGLVQLRQTYDPCMLYGDNYGYRSSLNQSMVRHLGEVVDDLRRRVQLDAQDIVLDIGSNDGTLLAFFAPGGPRLVGVDPTAAKFRDRYRADVDVIPERFAAELFQSRYGGRKAKIVTSIAMFYDLDDPLGFAREVAQILHGQGVWRLEQSYLPLMLERTAYDAICHEHLEYYALKQILWIMERSGLEVIEVSTNDVNGGSFAVTVVHAGADLPGDRSSVARLLEREAALRLDEPGPYEAFCRRIDERRAALTELLDQLHAAGRLVLGCGASTKGNVILQCCGIGPDRLPCIADVNEDKLGCVTPGAEIPIVSEHEARTRRPDYLLVLPWHFREAIIARERAFLEAGGRLIFPLPEVEVVAA